jgi:predicted  nucleic acid-binding Zn-ribbon protein
MNHYECSNCGYVFQTSKPIVSGYECEKCYWDDMFYDLSRDEYISRLKSYEEVKQAYDKAKQEYNEKYSG